jgi:predicted ABC-type ATPase
VPDPVLHLIAGLDGAGKTTFYEKVLGPTTNLAFVNADVIAEGGWPGAAVEHAYDAAALAADERTKRIQARTSFATETVFSHESKLALIHEAQREGYRVTLHIVLIPEDLAVARVVNRVTEGGHHVPEEKVRARFGRLWIHLRDAIALVGEARVYDNTTAGDPFRLVATYINGRLVGTPQWPPWTPQALREAGA